MTLFVNACVRSKSRTHRLAAQLISTLEGPVTEIRLEKIPFPVANEIFLRERDKLLLLQDYDNPMFALAREFAAADTIVIAAPFWDLSFPASLKQFFEQINVPGITFKYDEQGVPQGLCKAKKLYYVTTAGGFDFCNDYGFGYVRALAQNYYGIQDVRLIKAEGLDIAGADVEEILRAATKTLM